MDRKTTASVNGWNITLNRNVYMYCHSLSVKKGQKQISINCEDLPTKERTIGVWLHTSDVSHDIIIELQQTLLEWANTLDIKFQIHAGQNDFITSDPAT